MYVVSTYVQVCPPNNQSLLLGVLVDLCENTKVREKEERERERGRGRGRGIGRDRQTDRQTEREREKVGERDRR